MELPEEERFSKNVVIMAQAINASIQELYAAGYQTVNPLLVQVASTIISGYPKHELIQGFIENSHELCWDNIKKRDENYFVNNASDVFKYLPMDKVNLFKDLFLTNDENGKSVVSLDLKESIWKLFDAMIKISIKYIHTQRGPCTQVIGDKTSPAYKRSFFPEVQLENHAKKWGITLNF